MNTTYHRTRHRVAGLFAQLRGGSGHGGARVVAVIAAATVLAATIGVGWGLAADNGPPDPAGARSPAGLGSSSESSPAHKPDRSGANGPSGGGAAPGPGDSGGVSGSDSGKDAGGDEPPPSPEPGLNPELGPDPAPVDLERVLLLPVDLVAPLACFTAGLDQRYVDGYGAQIVDTRPHGELRTTRVEYDQLTRLGMNSDERRVHVLPGLGRVAEAQIGTWTVDIEVHVFLSGGFKIDYTRTHQGETGQFRQQFTSGVDSSCTVELVYAITTSPVP